jgi:hypothetical protein
MLNGTTTNAFTTDVDLEIVGSDIDAVQSQADSLKTALQITATTVGSTFCMAIFVVGHSDDYVSKTVLDTDEGLHFVALSLRIFHKG